MVPCNIFNKIKSSILKWNVLLYVYIFDVIEYSIDYRVLLSTSISSVEIFAPLVKAHCSWLFTWGWFPLLLEYEIIK